MVSMIQQFEVLYLDMVGRQYDYLINPLGPSDQRLRRWWQLVQIRHHLTVKIGAYQIYFENMFFKTKPSVRFRF
ncbi:hypothetical protein HanIR_Chr02g0086001 [Helianthus annuus]|nr:hypothetical protein HanIR_Chr02g0086001 [Helianthus annuus]